MKLKVNRKFAFIKLFIGPTKIKDKMFTIYRVLESTEQERERNRECKLLFPKFQSRQRNNLAKIRWHCSASPMPHKKENSALPQKKICPNLKPGYVDRFKCETPHYFSCT